MESSKPFIWTKDEKQPMDYNYEWDSEHEHALHYLISLSITDVGPGTIATMLQWSISRNEWFLTTGWRVQMTGNMREQALRNQISHLRSQFIPNQVDLEYEWLTRGRSWALDNQKWGLQHTAHPSPSYKTLVVALSAPSSTLPSTQKAEMHS